MEALKEWNNEGNPMKSRMQLLIGIVLAWASLTLFPATAMRLESPRSSGDIFLVTNTDDSGTGSLRQAILDANANPNDGIPDEIG